MDDEAHAEDMNRTLEEASWKSSYVLGLHLADKHDDRLFFRYYSETSEDGFSSAWVRIVALILIFCVSLAYNLYIFICLIRFPSLRTVTNCFTANIGLSNLVFSSTIPIVAWAWYSQTWDWGPFGCKITIYLQGSSIIVSYWTVTLLALDRYRCIVVPPYHSCFTPSGAVISSVLIWLFSLTILLPLAFWFQEVTDTDHSKVCTLVLPPTDDFPLFIYFLVGPMLLFWICPLPLSMYLLFQPYLKMLATSYIWASSSAMMENHAPNRHGRRQSEVSMSDVISPWTRRFSSLNGSTSGRQNSLSQQEETRRNKRMRVARILLCNAAFSAPLWALTSFIFVFLFLDGTRPMSELDYILKCTIFNVVVTVTYFFSLVNMMYYGFCSDNLRGKFKSVMCYRKQESNEITPPIGTKMNNNVLPAVKQGSIDIEIGDK